MNNFIVTLTALIFKYSQRELIHYLPEVIVSVFQVLFIIFTQFCFCVVPAKRYLEESREKYTTKIYIYLHKGGKFSRMRPNKNRSRCDAAH